MNVKQYDVIIIGTGPAGIFAALEMADTGLKVLMLEKGRDISARACPIHTQGTKCLNCKPCGILCGWGGAGAYSDGKLTLFEIAETIGAPFWRVEPLARMLLDAGLLRRLSPQPDYSITR